MNKYCTIKGYECGFSLGENKCVMDKPCTDIAEWIAKHDKQLRADERAKVRNVLYKRARNKGVYSSEYIAFLDCAFEQMKGAEE